MINEDRVFALLTESNPIPDVDDLDLGEVEGARYLETLEQRSSEVTKVDDRPGVEKNYERRRATWWLAAALTIIVGGIAFILVSQSSEQAPFANTPPTASDLIGTWDHVLDQTQGDVIVDDFQGLVDSADEVVVRLGFDGQHFWVGFLFDGELFLFDGVPVGDGGPMQVEGDRLILTGAQDTISGTFRWELEGNEVTFTWLEQCWLGSDGDDCTNDRDRMAQEDPLTIPIWENTFTKSSDDPSY